MHLPNVDHLIEDSPLAEAHRRYLQWIKDNFAQNQAMHFHPDVIDPLRTTRHAGECFFLDAVQRGSARSIARLRSQLPAIFADLYGMRINLPEIFVFAGETRHSFAAVLSPEGIGIVIDFRKALTIILFQFCLGKSAGNVRGRQLAAWLLLSVILAREDAFDHLLIALAHEARATDAAIFHDLVGTVFDQIIMHEIGHAVADQLPAEFTRVRYEAPATYWPKVSAAESLKQESEPLPSEVYPTLADDCRHWHEEFCADCFSIVAHFAILHDVYEGDIVRVTDALGDAFMSWILTFFGLGLMQAYQERLLSKSSVAEQTHPDGALRSHLVISVLTYLIERRDSWQYGASLNRSATMHRKIWQPEMLNHIMMTLTYFYYVPDGFAKFADKLLQPVLSGCLFDELRGKPTDRLFPNIDENAEHWDRFHVASHLNGEPVMSQMADHLAALEIDFYSEPR